MDNLSDIKEEELIFLTPKNKALTAHKEFQRHYDKVSGDTLVILGKLVDEHQEDIFTTVGMYINDKHAPGNACKSNGVPLKLLLSNVLYNISFRPGRALFVNGTCLFPGAFKNRESAQEQFDKKNYGDIKITRDTQPYV